SQSIIESKPTWMAWPIRCPLCGCGPFLGQTWPGGERFKVHGEELSSASASLALRGEELAGIGRFPDGTSRLCRSNRPENDRLAKLRIQGAALREDNPGRRSWRGCNDK